MKLFFALLFLIPFTAIQSQTMDPDFSQAVENGKLVNQGFNRCIAYVNAWMKYADASTGLIPRNITDSKDFWNAWDAAADNYPFMVLTSSILMPEFFKGKALDMLKTERQLTPRIGKLPDTYSFSKQGFKNETIDTNQLIFGAAAGQEHQHHPGQSHSFPPLGNQLHGRINTAPDRQQQQRHPLVSKREAHWRRCDWPQP